MLVTIEGIDGTGKTTVCDMLKSKFPHAIMTREPQDKEFISNNSSSGYGNCYAYLLDHVHHIENVISKKNPDNLIICDRYVDSRCAYQSVDLGTSITRIRNLHFNEFTIMPDATFILVCKIDELMRRLVDRDGPLHYLEGKDIPEKYRSCVMRDFINRLTSVQTKYIEIVKMDSNRCVLIDVTDLTAIDVANAIEFYLVTHFSKKMEYIRTRDINKKAIVESLTHVSSC